jgi:acyl-CoA synthetase (AMP-forming)/AMP-acid ligase II/acyl carrier protein
MLGMIAGAGPLPIAESAACTISGVISAWAGRRPDDAVVLAPGRQPLSWSRLNLCVEETVRSLNAMGVGRGDRVAVVLPDGPEVGVAFLAVASGAVFAPLNPAYKVKELKFYLDDLRARAMIVEAEAQGAAVEAAEDLGVPVIFMSPSPEAGAGVFTLTGDEAAPTVASGFAEADEVALVLHTSGSTSRPKIVPLTHRNLVSSAHNIRRTLRLAENDRSLNVMPLFHIHSLVSSVLASLAAGGSVVLTPGYDPARFLAWLEEFRPTWYTAAPTIHQAFLERARRSPERIAGHSLRFIRSGAAALAPQLMRELESTFRVPVVEFLGMTEAAQQITSNPLPPYERKPGSVGLPAGPQVAIMDEAGNLLPPGAAGEIVIRGDNVTPGYENNPEANDETFQGGWLRTGDQGYFDSDGYLFVTGRLKETINRGGEKISPREIDEVLLDHPGIAQAVTFAVPHARLGEDVGAAVVLKRNVSLSEMQIREFASARLADFKVPQVLKIVDAIPKGPTGKLQRIGLADVLGIRPAGDAATRLKTEFVPPRTPLERELAELWCEMLGVENVGIHDDFFSLGGSSIQATRLVNRVCRSARINLPLLKFLKMPTIAAMAREIEAFTSNRASPRP